MSPFFTQSAASIQVSFAFFHSQLRRFLTEAIVLLRRLLIETNNNPSTQNQLFTKTYEFAAMPSHENFLDDLGDYIRRILQDAGVPQCSIHLEKYGSFRQERTFYIDKEEEQSSGTKTGDTIVYGVGSHTKLLVALLLSLIVDKLSYSQEKGCEKYKTLRDIFNKPWETPFTELFNHFSDTKISTLPRNPTLRQIAFHYNSLPPMNHVLLALDGTSIMSKESFLRVGPRLAERAYKHSDDYNQYSNGNFILIGCLIEAIAKESLADVMREHLLKPLEMNHTSMGATAASDIRFAEPFVVSADGTRHHVDRSLYPEDSTVSAALAAQSSTRDFAALIRNMLACISGDESPLPKDLVTQLLKPEGILDLEKGDRISLFGICTSLETSTPGCRSPNRLISPVNICSTYSLGLRRGEKKVPVYYIAGATKGYTCSSYLIPKSKVFIIVFTNGTGRIDASDHISRLILQRTFDLSLNFAELASLGFKKSHGDFGIRTSDLTEKVVDVVGMSSRAAAEGQDLLERFAREDTEKGVSNLSPIRLDGIYHDELIEQTIIIEGEKARIISTADNAPHRQPEPTGFIRTGNLSIRLQPLQKFDFTIDRYDPYGWKELSFSLSIGKDANNNDRVMCLGRQSAMFFDEFKWTHNLV